ncbi:Lectin C-type domain [Popillia japonica]|uniref:Lectin C-type domain n=1 Tax=Popillia japonica TaxID=7064 RepID=A0AAW1IEA7_POPJA
MKLHRLRRNYLLLRLILIRGLIHLKLKQRLNPFEVEDIIREVSEREHRKNNLIIFNLSELPNASREEQCAGDLETIREVFSGLGVTANILKT